MGITIEDLHPDPSDKAIKAAATIKKSMIESLITSAKDLTPMMSATAFALLLNLALPNTIRDLIVTMLYNYPAKTSMEEKKELFKILMGDIEGMVFELLEKSSSHEFTGLHILKDFK